MLSSLEDCETIIREENVHDDEKTIKPIYDLGYAGGTKFIHKNKFIKMCTGLGPYTEDPAFPNIVAGDKAGLNEVRAVNAVTSALIKLNMKNLRTTLACSIRIKGRCFIIYALSPIAKDTIVYGRGFGSTDKAVNAGQFEEVKEKINMLGDYFNLEPHTFKGTELVTAADVEVHIAKDGRM